MYFKLTKDGKSLIDLPPSIKREAPYLLMAVKQVQDARDTIIDASYWEAEDRQPRWLSGLEKYEKVIASLGMAMDTRASFLYEGLREHTIREYRLAKQIYEMKHNDADGDYARANDELFEIYMTEV